MKICGILIGNDQWFISDNGKITNVRFELMKSTKDKICVHQGFRDYWISCLKPLYVGKNTNNNNISYYDLKTNWRRTHPYVDAILEWFDHCEKTNDIWVIVLRFDPFSDEISDYLFQNRYAHVFNYDKYEKDIKLKDFETLWKKYKIKNIRIEPLSYFAILIQKTIRRYLVRKQYLMHPDYLFPKDLKSREFRCMNLGINVFHFKNSQMW